MAVMPVDKDGKVTTAKEALEIALAPTGTADSRTTRLAGRSDIDHARAKIDGQQRVISVEVRWRRTRMSAWNRSCSTPWCPVRSANGPRDPHEPGVLSLYIDDATAKQIDAEVV